MTFFRLFVTLLVTTALVPCGAMAAGKERGWVAKTSETSMPAPVRPDMRLQPVMPQDDVLPATLDSIYLHREDIDQAMVTVEMGLKGTNPQWVMSPTQREVLLDTLLQFMPEQPTVEDAIWPKLRPVDSKYRGMRVVLHTVWGRYFEPIVIFEGQVRTASGGVMVPDYGRRLEYWMFGASRVKRDQLIGAHVLPVLTFEQCRLMGQQIVETRPRQCLLPDNNLLLETDELPTLKSARIKDFDGCLKDGKALIYTFPRRCIAAGGRVFTEPPRVYEQALPADVPMRDTSIYVNGNLVPMTDSVNVMGSAPRLGNEFGGGGGTPLMTTPVVDVSGTGQ